MIFPAGWDRLDPWTLRFLDSELERSYQHADHAEGVRRIRTTSLLAVGAWTLVAVILPPVVGVDPGPTWLISGLMAVGALVTAGVSQWATTQRRRDAIGMAQQLAAGVAVFALTTVTDTFALYALPGIMATAALGFSITRHPFTGAVVTGTAYGLLFVGFAVALGLTSDLALQFLILTIAIVAACVGGYTLERSQRTTFARGQLVSALREQVDQLLHRYVSPEVATALIEDPGRAALGGEELEVTVLFADLRGYTAFAERRAPAEVVAMLNSAFGVVVPIVFDEGGTVVQFMGDALMAIFNAPHPQPDHALRAARAALAMQHAVGELPDAATRPQFRVGLNSGLALVGNIGGAEMRNFAAIGDTTNLAARLQTYAAAGSIAIGANTYAHIREQAIVRPLGSPGLKGKSQPVAVYELIGLRSRPGESVLKGF